MFDDSFIFSRDDFNKAYVKSKEITRCERKWHNNQYSSYAFAMGWIDFDVSCFNLIPGEIAAVDSHDINMEDKILADLRMTGRKCINIMYVIPECLPKARFGTYWIIGMHLKGGNSSEWIFKRQDRNSGRWFCKSSLAEAPKCIDDAPNKYCVVNYFVDPKDKHIPEIHVYKPKFAMLITEG